MACKTENKQHEKVQVEVEANPEKITSYLKAKGAHDCFHKKSTFLDHLVNVHRILQGWKAPAEVCAFGFLHSVYGNSWVSLSICKDRKEVESLIGSKAEKLVYSFCTIDRLNFTFDLVLKKLFSMQSIPDTILFQDQLLPKRSVAIFILVTIADWLEQFQHWQDDLFQVQNRSDLASFFDDILAEKKNVRENAGALWPQTYKPGLFLHVLARLNLVLQKCDEPDLVCPLSFPVSCEAERKARDLYCECRISQEQEHKSMIVEAIRLNPFVPEFYNILAQILLVENKYEDALVSAQRAMTLFREWGTSWDKSVSYDTWLAHTSLLIRQASKKEWPKTALEMIELGS